MKKEQALKSIREKLAKAIKSGNDNLRDACKRIVSKLETSSKSLTDEELVTLFISVRNEYNKQIDSVKKYVETQTAIRDKLTNERNELLSSDFFPKLMSKEEIKKELKDIISSLKDDEKVVGKVLPKFKEAFPAKADLGEVSKIATELLTK